MKCRSVPLLVVAVTGFLLAACGSGTSNPSEAQQTYGAPVDAIDAFPAVAVAAEADAYVGRSLAVDGRIAAVRDDGCTLQLETNEGPPLLVTAVRTEGDGCAWQVPDDEDGVAVAAGPLRLDDDTLRLSANGVEVTPVHPMDSDS